MTKIFDNQTRCACGKRAFRNYRNDPVCNECYSLELRTNEEERKPRKVYNPLKKYHETYKLDL